MDGSYDNNKPGSSRLGIGISIQFNGTSKRVAAEWVCESTSMKAEYLALIHGLVLVYAFYKSRNLIVYADSQVMVRQLNGEYRVNEPSLIPYYERTKHLLTNFKYEIKHIPREENSIADKLSKICNLQNNNK